MGDRRRGADSRETAVSQSMRIVYVDRSEPAAPAPDIASVPGADLPDAHDEEARRRRKELKRLEDATRPLDAWERYRALNDAMDESYELIDIANREARFAVILMGALNAVLFVLATRTEFIRAIPAELKPAMAVALVAYMAVAVYFFVSAIDTLRPRRFRPKLTPGAGGGIDLQPRGVRYYEDVVLRDADAHWEAWREVRIGQLNAELAMQLHSLSLKNQAKHAALRRLYGGLRILTLIAAGLLMLLGLFAFRGAV